MKLPCVPGADKQTFTCSAPPAPALVGFHPGNHTRRDDDDDDGPCKNFYEECSANEDCCGGVSRISGDYSHGQQNGS